MNFFILLSVLLALTTNVLGASQTPFNSFNTIFKLNDGLNMMNKLADDLYSFDLNELVKDWEGEVLRLLEYPEQAVRIKEPKLCDDVKQYSGYLDTNKDKHFFFWFFESRGNPKKDPLILWLNGGPGCSSMLGLMMELGPCQVKNGTKTKKNPFSWNNNANILFLDQPINTGFSYGPKSVTTTSAASKDMYAFLQIFFKKFPRYRQLDFHIFGESYGGHYVPDLAKFIYLKNFKAKRKDQIKLKSIGVGNGMTDPLIQYGHYADMACKNNYHPVLPKSICQKMDASYPKCKKLIQRCYDEVNYSNCAAASNYCEQVMVGPYARTGLNPYDVRKKCIGNSLCYDIIKDTQAYFNLKKVKRELGVKVKRFEPCSDKVNAGFTFSGDLMYPYVNDVPLLLEGGIRVLLYSGDADFICNWMGNKAWAVELDWNKKALFAKAKDNPWISKATNKTIGEVRSVENFTFLRVYNAGHMVPYDQPENALEMVTTWLSNDEF